MSEEFYPMHILHSRYGGSYAGGPFILIAGVKNPRKNTEVVGSDNECMRFWNKVEQNGPEIEVEIDKKKEDETETKTIYVESDRHPSMLFERFQRYTSKKSHTQASNIITEVIREYPELEQEARQNTVALHKILALSQSIYSERYFKTDIIPVKQELAKRFLEYDSIPSIKDLSDEELDEVVGFVRSTDREPPLIYTY